MNLATIPTVRGRLLIGLAIFLLAFSVRALTWHDTRLEVGKVQTAVVADYQRVADLLRDGGIRSFFSSSSPLADLNNLGHPPGYPILVAVIYSIGGRSITAVQIFQIAADAVCAVVLFLIVTELLPFSAGVIAGLLAALSPQLAWNSVLLLPDSISVLPILLAVYVLTRAAKNPRLLSFVLVGALIGISCWLRANAMLLTFFVAAAVPLLVRTAKRWQLALAVICGTLLVVLPLMIRNATVSHRFIPLSMGAGQTLLEGIADYDKGGRFGIPPTDVGLMKQEAEIYQRPDYYGTLFNPDGVERERARLSRGFAVIRSHPFWFAGVMAKRASSMLQLERSRLLSTEPAVTHSLDTLNELSASATTSAEQLEVQGTVMPGAGAWHNFHLHGTATLLLTSNSDKYGPQFRGPLAPVKSATDYVAVVPMILSDGRMRISIENAAGRVYSSQVIEVPESTPSFDGSMPEIRLPFATIGDDQVRVACYNEAPLSRSQAEIGYMQLYELGPTKYLWTRYPRLLIYAIQKTFITAVVLPLSIIGLLILILRRRTRALVILSVVPIYFFLVQSIVHTEYRYVLAVVYFLFAFAGVTVGVGVRLIVEKFGMLLRRSPQRVSVPSA